MQITSSAKMQHPHMCAHTHNQVVMRNMIHAGSKGMRTAG